MLHPGGVCRLPTTQLARLVGANFERVVWRMSETDVLRESGDNATMKATGAPAGGGPTSWLSNKMMRVCLQGRA